MPHDMVVALKVCAASGLTALAVVLLAFIAWALVARRWF